MPVATLDPKKVIITVAGVPITGYSKSSFVKIEREEDSFKKETGADGLTTRVKSNNRSGTITITLQQSSISNSLLSKINRLDEQSASMVVPVTVTDLSGLSSSFSATGWVRKPADQEWGAEAKERQWMIDCADLSTLLGGNFTPEDMAADIAQGLADIVRD